MKRAVVIVGLLVLVMGLAACGGDDEGTSWTTEPDNTETTLTVPAFEPISAENVAQVALWETIPDTCGGTRRLAWSMDGEILGLVTEKTICLYWLLYPDSEPRQIDLSADAHAIAFSPDGKTLAAGSGQGKYELRLYDLETGKNTQKFKSDLDVTQIVFSPDGSLAAAVWKDGTVYVWNVADGTEVHKLVNPDNPATSVAISPDSKLIVTAAWESMQFWNLETGEKILHVVQDQHDPWGMVFSPDGTLLASWGGGNGESSVWDVATGVLIHNWGGSRMARSAAFTADGSALLVGYDNGKILALDVASGELLATLAGAGAYFDLSADGTLIAATDYDETPVTLWAIPSN